MAELNLHGTRCTLLLSNGEETPISSNVAHHLIHLAKYFNRDEKGIKLNDHLWIRSEKL